MSVVPVTIPAAAYSATAVPSTSASTSTENPTVSVTTSSSLAHLTDNSRPMILATKKPAPKKAVPKKKAAVKNVPATRCTLEHVDTWVPPPQDAHSCIPCHWSASKHGLPC